MRSKIFQEVLDETPKEAEIFVRLYADLVLKINRVLREKGYTQKLLADKLDKRPSEIHKWLNGDHNFTLRSIAKLQAELGEVLLAVPDKPQPVNYTRTKGSSTFKIFVNKKPQEVAKTRKWDYEMDYVKSKSIANAG